MNGVAPDQIVKEGGAQEAIQYTTKRIEETLDILLEDDLYWYIQGVIITPVKSHI